MGAAPSTFAAEKPSKEPENPACPHKNAKKVEKPLSESTKAREAKNWDEVLAKANEADAVPVEKTEYDKFVIHEQRGIAYASQKKYAEAVTELDASMNSPCYPEGEKNSRTKVLMQLAYQAKDWPKAIDYGAKHYAATGDLDTGLYLANAYYIKDDYANTKKVMGDVIAKTEENGRKPEESSYRILQSACYALKDTGCVNDMIERLVANYPKP